jgi:hypothetical protein
MHQAKVLLVLTAALLWMLAGCNDKGNGPNEVQYRLFVGPLAYTAIGGQGPDFYIFDTETDSLLDSSAVCNSVYFMGSSESQYILLSCGDGCCRILNSKSLAISGVICAPVDEFFLDPSENLAVGIEWPATDFVVIVIASLPAGDIVFQDTLFTAHDMDSLDIRRMDLGQIDVARGIVYGTLEYGRDDFLGSEYIGYDYVNHRIHDTWQPRPEGLRGINPRYDLHPDGTRMYQVAGGSDPSILCYNLQTETVEFRVSGPYSGLDYLQITPDGQQLYITQPGGFGIPPIYRKMRVLDADNGTLIAEISLDTLKPPGNFLPAFPKQIRFVPGTMKGYLAEGEKSQGLPGRVAVIDREQLRITTILDFEFGGYHTEFNMEVVPLP